MTVRLRSDIDHDERPKQIRKRTVVPASAACDEPTPERLLMLGNQYWAAKTLLSAVELGIFSVLAQEPLDAETLRRRVGLHPRAARDFLDALVALGVLAREDGQYSNTAETRAFLIRGEPTYIGGFDLPPVQPVFEEYVASFGLGEQLRFHAGDFFTDPLPRADVLVMGHVLHDWDLDQKRLLLAKAYDALPPGGALIVYDAMIDDERRENAFGLLMSLTMLLRTAGGFDYTGADCRGWLREAGFRDTHVEPLTETHSMAVGVK